MEINYTLQGNMILFTNILFPDTRCPAIKFTTLAKCWLAFKRNKQDVDVNTDTNQERNKQDVDVNTDTNQKRNKEQYVYVNTDTKQIAELNVTIF